MNSMSIASLVRNVRSLITDPMISKARMYGKYKDPNNGLYVEVFRSQPYDTKKDADWKLGQVRAELCEWKGWGEISGEIIPDGDKFRAVRIQYSVCYYCPSRVWHEKESGSRECGAALPLLCFFYNLNILFYTFFHRIDFNIFIFFVWIYWAWP